MSSIRPLVTITILVAVGVFFFTKLNEGPVPLPPEADTTLEPAPVADVPPLAADSTASPLTPAPSWSDPAAPSTAEMSPAAPTVPPTSLTAEAPTAQSAAPEVEPAELPPIPELPPVATSDSTAAPTAPTPTDPSTAAAAPIPLPANIPVAQYPGDAAPTMPEVAQMTPPAPLNTQPLAQSPDGMPLPPTAEAAMPATPPVTPMMPAGDDRYGSLPVEAPLAATPTPPATAPAASAVPVAPAPEPSAPTFASAWPEIQGALERQELVAAHAMLSRWYGNPSLTPAEAQQVETLLSQLAGTIVYSTEHRLEPPYTVKQGDTLQTIAEQYEVPWQLLAKINGIATPDNLQPGTQLKVIHGPFTAVVELDKSQLTLMLDGRYAGRFPASIEQGTTVSEGKWILEQKLVQPTTQDSTVVSAAYTPATVDHVLVLRNESPSAAGATMAITGGSSTPSGPTAAAPGIRLSPRDVEEVADILSIGSPVTIRR
ncbi:MAG: LysM peptidoglycan-binding domain-containing protein [Pirellulales bacterium]